MRVVGVVPARGGSKGVPRKNLRMLAGRPLMAYTLDAALASRRLDAVVVSTDDDEIAEAAARLGAAVPFRRPAELAGDDAPMAPVLAHAVRELEAADGRAVDVAVLLQPTSPLRRAEHIDQAVDLLERTGADSVVTVVEVPHQYSPASVMVLEGDRLSPYLDGPPVLRRQDKPRVFARNGPAVLAIRPAVLGRASLYDNDCRALVMAEADSLDIDSAWDLTLAEFVLAGRTVAGGR